MKKQILFLFFGVLCVAALSNGNTYEANSRTKRQARPSWNWFRNILQPKQFQPRQGHAAAQGNYFPVGRPQSRQGSPVDGFLRGLSKLLFPSGLNDRQAFTAAALASVAPQLIAAVSLPVAVGAGAVAYTQTQELTKTQETLKQTSSERDTFKNTMEENDRKNGALIATLNTDKEKNKNKDFKCSTEKDPVADGSCKKALSAVCNAGTAMGSACSKGKADVKYCYDKTKSTDQMENSDRRETGNTDKMMCKATAYPECEASQFVHMDEKHCVADVADKTVGMDTDPKLTKHLQPQKCYEKITTSEKTKGCPTDSIPATCDDDVAPTTTSGVRTCDDDKLKKCVSTLTADVADATDGVCSDTNKPYATECTQRDKSPGKTGKCEAE